MDDMTERCWICLGGMNETPPNGVETAWKRPCPCNLIAHESCLLEWTSEVANNGSGKVPQCPQCKSVVHVIKRPSQLIQLRQFIESTNRLGFQFMMVTTVGGTVLCTIYTTLYTLGASSIRFLCPTDLALRALGIRIDGASIKLDPLTWRRMVMIPALPLVLVFSSSRSRLMDVVSFLMPLGLSDADHAPWRFSGPRLTLALLPWARLCYQTVYDAVVEPFIQRCAYELRPSQDPRNNGGPPSNTLGGEFNIRLVLEEDDEDDDEEGEDERNGGHQQANGNVRRMEHANGEAADMDLAQQVGGGWINRLIYSSVEWLVEVLDDDNNNNHDNNNNNLNRRPPPQSANWVISPRSMSLHIGHALLWPVLSGMAGSLLSALPFVRRMVPDRFNRNILGGMLVIGARDVVNIITAILRVRQEKSRSVLEYDQLHNHRCIHNSE